MSRLRAEEAWQVRRGDRLQAEADTLRAARDPAADRARARALYLEGRFLECLDARPEGADELREDAEDALLVDVPWPETVLRTRRLAEGAPEGGRDLARVVDEGAGEGLALEAFGLREGRHLRLDLELQAPGGRRLREGSLKRLPLGELVAFEAARLGGLPALRVEHLRDGHPLLDLGVGTPKGLRFHRFQGGGRPRLEGREVTVPREGGGEPERWRWEGGRFVREGEESR